MTKKKLVIYTVLTGSKEPLGNPMASLPADAPTDLDISWICFTDNRALSSPVWEMRYLDRVPLPPEKLSRRPKAMPHEYLAEWEFSLYIDNITVFKRLPQSSDLAHGGEYLFKAYQHATRANPQLEADAIIQLGYESADRLCSQLDHYARLMPLDSITPLSTCTVLLREHHHPKVAAAGVTWWEQILNWGKRDQMSFDFALKWNDTRIEFFPGLKHESDLIENTANLQPNRVHANFDAVKYAWLHREDPAALTDPRQHYLDHGRYEGRSFVVRDDVLEYLCHRHGSSAGTRVAPRRGIAAPLQDLLHTRRKAKGRMLLIRMLDDSGKAAAYTAEELERFEFAFCAYLGGHSGTRLELKREQLAEGNLALRAGGETYELVVIMGMPGELVGQALHLVRRAVAPEGIAVLMSYTPCPLADVARAEAALAEQAGSCRSSVHGSRHDGLDEPLANSLVTFQWGPAP